MTKFWSDLQNIARGTTDSGIASITWFRNKFGQMTPLALPHCLGLFYWLYQLVLSWYLHQPESHQLSFKKVSQWVTENRTHRSDQGDLGPIKNLINSVGSPCPHNGPARHNPETRLVNNINRIKNCPKCWATKSPHRPINIFIVRHLDSESFRCMPP